MTFCYTYVYQPCSTIIKKLLSAADGSPEIRRAPQPHIVQRVRDLGTLCPKSYISIKSIPTGIRESGKKRQKEYKSLRELRVPRKQEPLNQCDQCIEIESAVCTGPVWVSTRRSLRTERTNVSICNLEASTNHLNIKIQFPPSVYHLSKKHSKSRLYSQLQMIIRKLTQCKAALLGIFFLKMILIFVYLILFNFLICFYLP